MEVYRHEGDLHHPTVNFNQSTGILALTGRSLPANPKEFYDPYNWLDSTIIYKTLIQKRHCILSWSISILEPPNKFGDMMKSLKNLKETGKTELVIEWCFEEDDEDMEEAARRV